MIRIIYVGKDENYFNGIKKRFIHEVTSEEIEFKRLWHEDENTFQKLAVNIIEELPNIAFLDYSSSPLKMLTVARSLPRLFDRGCSLIGLWDSHANESLVKESFTIGIPFNHKKSPEYGDIVTQALYLLKGGAFPEGKFAKAEMLKELVPMMAHNFFRIGYISEDYLHCEHDFIPKEQHFKLKHSFGDNFPDVKFNLLRRLDENYYYEMAYVSDLGLVYYENKDQEEKVKEGSTKGFWLEQTKEDSKNKVKKKLLSFLKNHQEQSVSKRTRLLVIDENIDILRQATHPIDTYPFSIRFFRSISHKKNLMNKVLPGIICYQCPLGQVGELREIVDRVKEKDNFAPYLVVFQSSWKSEKLIEHYEYERIVAYKDPFDFDLLLKLCESFEKVEARNKTRPGKLSFHDKEVRYYIKKDSPESYLEYEFPISVRSICETWLKFQTSENLALWSIHHIHEPVPFSFTIVEALNEGNWGGIGGQNQYRGVIHNLGEKERARIRVSVNQTIYKVLHPDEEKEKQEKKKL